MSDLLTVCDFSATFIPSISADAAAGLAQTYGGFIEGYDSGAASAQTRATLVAAGLQWLGAYRLPVAWRDIVAQVQDTINAIHASNVLCSYLVLDLEPSNGVSLTIAQIEQAMNTVEAASILPSGTLVRPCIYSSRGIWASYPGYTGPADRGWFAWVADWNGAPDLAVAPFGGFSVAQVVGHQYTGNVASSIGTVDQSVFSVPTAPIDPTSALHDIDAGLALMDQARQLFANAGADITP